MTDSINTLPLEGWAYKITDRPCSHHKDGRHKGDCSVCTREVLVEAVAAETSKLVLQNDDLRAGLALLKSELKEREERIESANRLNSELRGEFMNLVEALDAEWKKGDGLFRTTVAALDRAREVLSNPLFRVDPMPTVEDLLGECRECNRLMRDCGNHGRL